MPEEYDEQLFQSYLDNRAKVFNKKINTDLSVFMLRTKLRKFYYSGFDTNEILRQSTEAGWRSVYVPGGMEPKQKHERARGALKPMITDLVKKASIPPGKSAQEKHTHAQKVRGQGLDALKKAASAGEYKQGR